MAKDTAISQEKFDALLDWLDQNREAAGQKYEKIRTRLIRIFVCRGCFEAEELADTTINRVISKMPQIVEKYIGEPTYYFLGVADNIFHEWTRRQKHINQVEAVKNNSYEPPEVSNEYECLEKCLETLSPGKRELIVDYYKEEKAAKIEWRRSLAAKLGISDGNLHVKVHRLRLNLQNCVEQCVSSRESV